MIDNDWDSDSLDRFIRHKCCNSKEEKEYNYSNMLLYMNGFGNNFSAFDSNCWNGVERIDVDRDCFKNVNQLVIYGLKELRSIVIGEGTYTNYGECRQGNKCVIMNCDQLREIHIGKRSFSRCKSFELKNLPSLISIQLDSNAFCFCQSIVFESMNDWMNDEWDLIRLQSITLGSGALAGDSATTEWNVLIMKSMNDNNWLID